MKAGFKKAGFEENVLPNGKTLKTFTFVKIPETTSANHPA